jgi:hypothetical protein
MLSFQDDKQFRGEILSITLLFDNFYNKLLNIFSFLQEKKKLLLFHAWVLDHKFFIFLNDSVTI